MLKRSLRQHRRNAEELTTLGNVKRVLIYRLGSLGDTVVSLPSLHLVARAFPGAERQMLTNFPINAKAPAAAAVLGNSGLVHGYLRYAVGTRSVLELLKVWWAVARWRPQVLVYLAPARGVKAARRDAAFFRLCGVKRQIGVPLTEAMQACRIEADGALEYEASRLARNLAELGDARLEDEASWDLGLTEAEKARAASALEAMQGRAFVAVSIGTKCQANDWERENWRELLGRVAAEYPQYGLAVTGAAVDREYSEWITRSWRATGDAGPVVNLCGELTPRESAAVFAQATVFLGHDSGPMHLAAAVGTPCVAVFSARGLPRTWFPYGKQHRVIYHQVECAGCGLEVCTVEKKRCIRSVSLYEVREAVRKVLNVAG